MNRLQLIRKTKLRDLQSQRKLCLVLDLDHTLIHSQSVHKLSQQEKERFLNKSNSDDIFQWNMTYMGINLAKYVTKLRPFVRKFLEEANNLFLMYIYTMGTRKYALNIVKLLDPERQYFGSRIISREDCTKEGQKGLDVVHVDESGVIILDDTESVWTRHKQNLIVMDRYKYFATNKESSRTLSEDGIDEIGGMGALRSVLQVLKEVHRLYFEWKNCFDVRDLLEIVRKKVLKGCKIVMCEEDATTPALRALAEQMGAVCLDEYSNALATHVVCSDAYTTEARLEEEIVGEKGESSTLETSKNLKKKSHLKKKNWRGKGKVKGIVQKKVLECKIVMCEEDATTQTLQILAEHIEAVCLNEYSNALATHV